MIIKSLFLNSPVNKKKIEDKRKERSSKKKGK